MAELAAVYHSPEHKTDFRESGWRKELPLNRPIKLGRVQGPGYSDWSVEDDASISRVNATLVWDGTALAVEQFRPAGGKTTSDVIFRDRPAARFVVGPGESFVIGTTRFTLHAGPGAGPPDRVTPAGAPPPVEMTLSRDALRSSPFAEAEVVLRALEELPDVLRLVTEDARLLQKVVDILLKAVGRAEAAAVVRLGPDATKAAPTVSVVCHKFRTTPAGGQFQVSRKLAYKALREERKSVSWVWGAAGEAAPAGGFTIRAMPGVPWAVCTPLRDDSGLGLYVGGSLAARHDPATPPPAGGPSPPSNRELADFRRRLTGYQKVVELVASILESIRKSHALERLLAGYRPFLPRPVRAAATDPGVLDEMLKPRQATVTVLFCDLRGRAGWPRTGNWSGRGRKWPTPWTRWPPSSPRRTGWWPGSRGTR